MIVGLVYPLLDELCLHIYTAFLQLEGPFLLFPPMLCKDWQEPFQKPFQRHIFHMKTKLKDEIEFRKLVRKLFLQYLLGELEKNLGSKI